LSPLLSGIPITCLGFRNLLGPSNAYVSATNLQVTWYDNFFDVGLSFLGSAQSVNNGVTYTYGTDGVVLGDHVFAPFTTPAPACTVAVPCIAVITNIGPVFLAGLTTAIQVLPFTMFPHLAADRTAGVIYMIFDNGIFSFSAVNNFVLSLAYSNTGDLTTATAITPFLEAFFEDPGIIPTANQIYPAITVEQDDGTVHVSWADQRNIVADLGATVALFFLDHYQIFYSGALPASLQPASGGFGTERWTSPLVVSSGNPNAPGTIATGIPLEIGTPFIGDYFSIAAGNSPVGTTVTKALLVHPAWTEGTRDQY